MKKVRIDQLVFDRGLTESRERAKTSIMSGLVFVNGQRLDKPGMSVDENAIVELKGAVNEKALIRELQNAGIDQRAAHAELQRELSLRR